MCHNLQKYVGLHRHSVVLRNIRSVLIGYLDFIWLPKIEMMDFTH